MVRLSAVSPVAVLSQPAPNSRMLARQRETRKRCRLPELLGEHLHRDQFPSPQKPTVVSVALPVPESLLASARAPAGSERRYHRAGRLSARPLDLVLHPIWLFLFEQTRRSYSGAPRLSRWQAGN